jgi:DNA modification methylase
MEGDCLERLRELPDGTVQTCVTSPPYYNLRDYQAEGQIGLEPTPDEYVQALVGVFREVRRVLRDDGTLWLNLGDSYCSTAPGTTNAPMPKGSKANAGQWATARVATPAGMKPKDLMGIPWMVAFALRADGWYLRSEIVWFKSNPMPESVTDRPTKAHEQIFLLSKQPRYFYDADAIREEHDTRNGEAGNTWGARKAAGAPMRYGHDAAAQASAYLGQHPGGRNKRSVWEVATAPFPGAHFAVFPPKLIEPCILAGSAVGDVVLDPFAGAGTTGLVATRHGRGFVGIELNPAYAEMARQRIRDDQPLMNYLSEAA